MFLEHGTEIARICIRQFLKMCYNLGGYTMTMKANTNNLNYTLPYKNYVDPEVFNEENEKIFAKK